MRDTNFQESSFVAKERYENFRHHEFEEMENLINGDDCETVICNIGGTP